MKVLFLQEETEERFSVSGDASGSPFSTTIAVGRGLARALRKSACKQAAYANSKMTQCPVSLVSSCKSGPVSLFLMA